MPSPGTTAIRYCFFSLLIESFLNSLSAREVVCLIGLQWTKLCHGATLQVNVDGFSQGGLTSRNSPTTHQTPFPHQASNPMDLYLRGKRVIITDIGAAGEKFDANYIAGSAGNAALMAFTRALGSKSLADNIRVVGINPGPVGTDRHVTLLKTRAKHQFGDENRYKEFQKGFPLGRPAHAREIGDLMAFLASDRSGYTSGVIFTVDGGISAGWG